MVHPTQQTQPYCERRSFPRLTLTRNGRTRSFTIRPWFVGVAISAMAFFFVAYFSATAYLIYRDDLLGTAVSRQVEMQYAYEERIAALRAELDRVTSRHLVQTEGVEQQLARLLEQQDMIEQRQTAIDGLVERARATGIDVAVAPTRLPRARPETVAAVGQADAPATPLAYAPTAAAADAMITGTLMAESASPAETPNHADIQPILGDVGTSLDAMETEQSQALDALANAAQAETEKLSTALEPLGIRLAAEDDPQGGPFVPMVGLHFVERAALVARAIEDLSMLKRQAEAMPLGMPLNAEHVSSGYGYRMDPFLNRRAFHTGLDFPAPSGTLVRTTAAGTVTSAGWDRGYGQMVEVKHENGLATRYGHLSGILVSEGDVIEAGAPIGRVGSTGRSTGPHLHYETRRDGETVNPTIFLTAGRAAR